ncbi:MAG: glycosyltransferase family protein [Psychrilyobacter sp.]|uniref:cytidylyltransferase domain-containing protein n=1 Tax=Psychrilyobacter sp. TaxID=2586924 RepID=UPI003C7302F5
MKNIVCIIQARTTSSRLPNKVLLPLPFGGGKTVLENVLDRVKKSKYINKIVIATTNNETDNLIENKAKEHGVEVFRGSEDNVLSRYYGAAKLVSADKIVRITSDCPCIDPKILDNLIKKHLEEKNDYTSNGLKRSYPHGLDCEIFNMEVLEEANKKAKEKIELEHVTPYIYKTNPNKFKIGHLVNKEDYHDIRITLDTKEDYNLLCSVFDYLYEKDNYFDMNKIVVLFQKKPWIKALNSNVEQKIVCNSLKEELLEAIKLIKKQDLNRAGIFLEEKLNEEK